MDSFPGQGTKIPHASWPENQNINNRSNIVTNSIKIFLKIFKKKRGGNPEVVKSKPFVLRLGEIEAPKD